MKKIILAILLFTILALSGCKSTDVASSITGNVIVCNKPYIQVGTDCCLDKNDNSICDKDEAEEKPAEPIEQPIEETPKAEEKTEEETTKLGTGEYLIKEGETIVFEGKAITVASIDFFQGKLETTIDIEGLTREIYDTKKEEIMKGLKVQVTGHDALKNTVTIKLEKFELGENEYLLRTINPLEIDGIEISLIDVLKTEKILLNVIGKEITKIEIREGETKELEGLKITNMDGFYNGFKNHRYAILQIEAA